MNILKNSNKIEYLKEFVLFLRKVARIEFPSQWPELVELLATGVREASTVPPTDILKIQQFAFILVQLAKEQESKRLMAGRKESLALGPLILPDLFRLYTHVSSIEAAGEEANLLVHRVTAATLRISRIGFLRFYENPMSADIVAIACTRVKRLISQDDEKFAGKLMKEMSFFVDGQLLSFSDAIGDLLACCLECITRGLHAEYALQTLLSVVSSSAVQDGEASTEDEVRKTVICKFRRAFSVFLQAHPMTSIVELVVRCGLKLQADDVRDWMEAPDESANGPLDGDELRSVAEQFVVAVGVGGVWEADIVDLAILRFEQECAKPIPDILELDAWMCVIVLLHSSIGQRVTAVIGSLLPILSRESTDPNIVFLQFRIIQLVRTTSTRLDKAEIEAVIPILASCLAESRPVVVRLSAVTALKSIFDRTSDHHVWDTIGSSVIEAGIGLLGNVDAADVQWRLLNTVTLMATSTASSTFRVKDYRLIANLFFSKNDLIKYAIFDLLKGLLASVDTPEEPLIAVSLQIVKTSLHSVTVGRAEDVEPVVQAAASLLSAVIRVLARNHVAHITPYIEQLIDTVPKLVANESVPKEVIECLIDFNCLGGATVRVPDQCAIIQQYLQSDISEAVADEALLLLEIVIASVPNVDGMEPLIGPLVAFLQSEGHLDDDTAPLPLDSVINCVCSLAVAHPNSLVRMASQGQITNIIRNLLDRCRLFRLARSELRVLNALLVLIPYAIGQSQDLGLQYLSKIVRMYTVTQAGIANDCQASSLLTMSNMRKPFTRFDSSAGMPLPRQRNSVVESVRSVDIEKTIIALREVVERVSIQFPGFSV